MAKSKDLVWGRITDPDLGIDAEVFIANENGWFYTTDKDGALARQNETLAGLRTLLRESATKKRRESTRVKVPVTLLGRDGDGGRPRGVHLTGLTKGGRHGTEVLTKGLDGRQDAGRIRSYTTVYRVFTPDEVVAYTALLAAQEAANKAVSGFETTRRLAKNAQQLVEEAQATALARPKPGKGWRVPPKPGEGIPVEEIVADAQAEVE